MPHPLVTAVATRTETSSILIIDDDVALSRVMAATLEANGYSVTVANNGGDGIAAALEHHPALVVLDMGLPDMDGVDVCRSLREWSAHPIVVLSGEEDERRKVEALDAGANDYVTKPFSVPELLARFRAAIRTAATTVGADRGQVIEVGDLVIDVDAHAAVAGSTLLELTRIEFTLIAAFAANVGGVLTHQAIIGLIWPDGAGPGAAGALRVHLTNLRRKLGAGPRRPVILTVPKLGYRMVVPGSS